MNRLQAITALRDSHALAATETAIDSIRDWLDRWGQTLEPEERGLTLLILGELIEAQANAVIRATRMGEVMSLRIRAEEAAEQQEAA